MKALTDALREAPEFQDIEQKSREKAPLHVHGLNQSAIPLFTEAIAGDAQVRLIVTYEERRARELAEGMKCFDRAVYFYPAKDALFYYADVAGNEAKRQRLSVIKRIAEGEKVTVVMTVEGLMDKLPALSDIKQHVIRLSKEEEISPESFSKRLVEIGYERTQMVELPGQFSVRGDILDIYPLTEECPYRVTLWGDEIETIRSFDVESQRSIEEVSEVTVYPAAEICLDDKRLDRGLNLIEAESKKQLAALKGEFRTEQYARLKRMVESAKEELTEWGSTTGLDSMVEYFYEETVSFLDYVPTDAVLLVDEPEKVKRHAETYSAEFARSMEGRLLGGYVLPTQARVLYGGKEIVSALAKRKPLLVSELYTKQPAWKEASNAELTAKNAAGYNNSFETLLADLEKYKKKSYRIVILSPSATRGKRIAADLRSNDCMAHFSEDKFHRVQPGEVWVTLGRIDQGYELPQAGLLVISEGNIFKRREIKKRGKLPKYHGDRIASFDDVSIGDYVVHQNHGVGIYRGLDKVETDGRLKDYITIEYAKGSKLFIPVDQLFMIGKLSAKDGAPRKLNRLGGPEWERVRSRVKTHVTEIAEELVNLYALRETMQGFAYSPDTPWQREFEELFPYEETADQEKAIEDTKHDMETGKIMDRLVCGDVGFGKTEVAIRAAFKAVQDNRQVAYLVPTTILAEQHFETFTERMKDFPVTVRMLSRFCTAKQIRETLAELESGKADIVIGTHRLLSKDVSFKRLGLLIIDEEQRFGVKHKEKIKQMKKNVDVLTLTATPIPRTLHMSMVGLRDISLLEEPPIDRMPIQTYVMEYDTEFVKEAITRELARDGQVYYVYNRVNTIEDVAAKLRELLPNARIEFAHGKMNERELEDIMHAFIHKEIDVLVSTTIIETGLDIPNVNTIIVQDADRFGLAQLYQLRGRVGRSSRSAYAFLMYKRDKVVSEVAEKRLSAIREFTDLGSGYRISMRDLEIRGAGNLLGEEQSGNIEAVGYDLYCKMLSDAVKRLSGQETMPDFTTAIELPVEAYIPDTYVKNEFIKLDLYKRISRCENHEDTDDILEEVRDRFGEPPREFLRLLDIANIRGLAHRAYITDVKYTAGEVRILMVPDAPVHADRMDGLLREYRGTLKFVPGELPGFSFAADKTVQEELLTHVEQVTQSLYGLIEGGEDQ